VRGKRVARSARYVLRGFRGLGRDRRFRTKGRVFPLDFFPGYETPKVATWLLEAAVTSAPDGVTGLPRPGKWPMLFPFQIGRMAPEHLAASGRLEVVRHGLEETIVRVRRPLNGGRARAITARFEIRLHLSDPGPWNLVVATSYSTLRSRA